MANNPINISYFCIILSMVQYVRANRVEYTPDHSFNLLLFAICFFWFGHTHDRPQEVLGELGVILVQLVYTVLHVCLSLLIELFI